MRVKPGLFVRDERVHECHRLCEPATVWKRKGEKIVLRRRVDLADRGDDVEIEKTVRIRLRASQLQREAAITSDLIRHNDFFESLSAKFGQLTLPSERRELRDLHYPACTVIILRVALFQAVLRGGHPIQVLREPLA